MGSASVWVLDLMPSSRNAYRRIVSGCTKGCSLNSENLPTGIGELVHRWFEEGYSNQEIIKHGLLVGAKLSNGAIGRHRSSHLHAAQDVPVVPVDGSGEKLTDLEVIERVIQAGASQVSLVNAKVSTEQLLAAIALKHKLTEGSVFDAMFAQMAGEDEDLSDLEGDAAVRSDEERGQRGADDGSSEGS